MSEPVRIHIDLSTGAVEVSAPAEAVDSILSRLESFIPQISGAHRTRQENSNAGEASNSSDDPPNPPNGDQGAPKGERGTRGRKAAGKRATYTIVDLGLEANQREALRSFFSSKNPKGQNDQTLVLMSWLTDNAEIQSFGWNEIYTAFRLINDVKVPAKISSVLGNMIGQGVIANAGGGKYRLTHVGEDRVRLELPAKQGG